MERVSLSKYKDNFVLKGGMLVASLLGIDTRSTMDIDTTVKALPLTQDDIKIIVEDICKIQLEDNVIFKVTSFETIMDDFDYPGVRVHLEGIPDDKIDIVMWTIRAVIG
ncbi:MAG: nucleotidyl transferase AbiEii/AbiGii toxin family protein [Butyrivibrio sp.]|nr:nucleotidyl transferase AbiEii/AbiGii toxin family protein [Butyrivibrio sp.]